MPGEDGPEPFHQQRQAIFFIGHEGQVGHGPQPPGREARQLDPAQVGHGAKATQHRHAAEIKPGKGFVAAALQLGANVFGNPAAHLHRWTGHARQGFAIGGVLVAAEIAHHADFRVIGDGEIRLHQHPPAAVHLTAGGFGQLFAEMGGAHTSGPEHVGRLDRALTLRRGDQHFTGHDRLNPAVEAELHTHVLQLFGGSC